MEFNNETFQQINQMGNAIVRSSLKQFEGKTNRSGLSIKMPLHGEEHYTVDEESFRLKEGQFLLVNKGQDVRCRIDSTTHVKGVCLYLDHDNFIDALNGLTSDSPLDPNPSELIPEVIPDAYELTDGPLCKALIRLGAIRQQQDLTEEDYYALTIQLAEHQLHQHKMMSRLEANSYKTKKELLRRLKRARNYIYDNFDKDLQLEDISRTAYLSKYHLLRSYKMVFKSTPYQSLLQRRIEVATQLLSKGCPIQDVADYCGFNSRRSFSRAFKRLTGQTPTAFQLLPNAIPFLGNNSLNLAG
ncbi:MAG: AraC family transcriptional regulator [Bacteroidota bacterium]